MRRKNFLITALICGVMMSVAITGCNNEDNFSDGTLNSETEDIQLRSATLGFTDVADYQSYVIQQCAAGNHENCCFLSSGTHQICSSPTHLGINRNGAFHKGGNHKGQGNNCGNCTNPNCTGFVDANGDGICDNHTGTGASTGTGNCTNPNCTGFVDANGDGICDKHTGTGTGTGNCTNPNCTGFVDANGDGICDKHTGTGTGTGNCTNPNCTGFVDVNGDGICDKHTGTGTGTGNGTGNGNGNGNGKGGKPR